MGISNEIKGSHGNNIILLSLFLDSYETPYATLNLHHCIVGYLY